MTFPAESAVPDFLSAIATVAGNAAGGLHEPAFMGLERAYVNECLDSGLVSSVGPFVTRFEDDLARYVGAAHAVAVVNGTSALHLALVAGGVKPGDEVIVPALSFVATAAAVVLAGAIPHFVDVSEDSWGISPEALKNHLSSCVHRDQGSVINKATRRPISALLPMHTLGHPFDAEGIREVAEEFGLLLVEDAAEALGSFYGEAHVGLHGLAGVFSFNGNKTITTGGGGAVVTNDENFARKLKHLSTTAKVSHRFEFNHDSVGYNYRMPNINAALGVAQLEQLPRLIGQQRVLYNKYHAAMMGITEGALKKERPGTRSNYWLQAFSLNPEVAPLRDEILNVCLDAGIPVRPLWKPLNTLGPYKGYPSAKTPTAFDLYTRVICLPSSARLAESVASVG